MSKAIHKDMYLFSTIMEFTNRYDIANKVYDELFGKTWTIDKIEKYVSIFTSTKDATVVLDKIESIIYEALE